MDFYIILDDIMKNKGLSIAQVARQCNLSDSTIRSVIARKTKKVSLDVAFKLSKGLNISLEELNGETPKPSNNLSSSEFTYIEDLRKLNDEGINKAINYTKDLTEIPKYHNTTNVVEVPKKEIWEEEGKEHLMPLAAHDDNLTQEQKDEFNMAISNLENS